ncbi:LptF/LptG family permease [Bacteroides sp. 224]|uniref:LptF/LptG family permease n=1 Tax=Bacteroides sp. 224 TaxID=2302936 RepID=UPI0013D3D0C5|nr:LptF/LptG family permease [Bacteroides sp. 224]NDV64096.1 YjgP/YjgQ family permease [Bacteroides sp. 224]
MLRIKKLDIFIVKSFGLLFIGTFFICLFIFMMQFLWRYVDELVGKGLEMDILAQFFYYSALSLVPASLPLAILLASLITFGNFGERYELLAMKAAGISLLQIMRPLIVMVTILCGISFLFQNVIGPHAQLKLYTLIYSMKQASPELEIPEGVFYDGVPGYNIKVHKKDRKTGMLNDVLIYDLKEGFDNASIINAESGKLEMTADKKHLYLHLYNGEMFQSQKPRANKAENVPYRTETFREKHTIIEFDSEFNMADESIMSTQASSKSMGMLETTIDSVAVVNDSIGRSYFNAAIEGVYQPMRLNNKEDSLKFETARIEEYNVDSLFDSSTLSQKQKVINMATSRAESQRSDWMMKSITVKNNDYSIRRHKTEWHRKITVAISCLLFFFIGAPLGAIIRKGGLGMPVVVSVVLFIFYYVIDNMGYKMARDGKWMMFVGMWLSTFILAVLGVFFTYKSNKDSVVFNGDVYAEWFKRVVGIRSVRHLFRKDVIINDPDYWRIPRDLDMLSENCQQYMYTHKLTQAPNYFKLWVTEHIDEDIKCINLKLDSLVDELSNSRSVHILNALSSYPIIPVSAHSKPFKQQWLNILSGVIFPIGLFFYFRIWTFRIRLQKDLEQVIKTNEAIKTLIMENENEHERI